MSKTNTQRNRGAGAHAGTAGFTMLELLVSVSLIVIVMTIVLTAFDVNSVLSRVQQDVSELQQSVRVAQREIAHNARMTGRGGLPRTVTIGGVSRGISIDVTQNVAANTLIASDADPADGTVLEGTDVLTLRGTFRSPIYKVDAGDEDTFVVDIPNGTATLIIDDVTRSGFDQPLTRLQELTGGVGGADPEPILLISRHADTVYAVVELEAINVAPFQLPQGNTVNRATLTLNIAPGAGTNTAHYLSLSGGFPAALTAVNFASVLEEYRYYVREDFSIPGDDTSPLSPKLSRARIIPGTDPPLLHPQDGSVGIDIADGIFDLQLALGIDVLNPPNGEIDELDGDGDPLAGNLDEWLYNHADDDLGWAWDASTLRLVRLTFLGQAGRPDRQYIAPAIASIENRDYDEPPVPTVGQDIAERRYRRRLLQSVVDLRNL